jgi:predicted nucleic acid-binding protein
MFREIFEEYLEIMVRLGLKDEKETTELMNLFIRGFNTIWTFEPPHLKVEMKDSADIKFLECAVACRNAYVITGDAEFRKIGSYDSEKILPPDEFLAQVKLPC